MARVPVLLFGEAFWRKMINWEALAEAGTIGPDDLDLFRFVETAGAAMMAIDDWRDATIPDQSNSGISR
jgi:predicted Rossmann-fold nucleotide-binding protein